MIAVDAGIIQVVPGIVAKIPLYPVDYSNPDDKVVVVPSEINPEPACVEN